jgi:hypothetical protein
MAQILTPPQTVLSRGRIGRQKAKSTIVSGIQ